MFASELYNPPTVPADCPGAGNSVSEFVARGLDDDCFTGEVIGKIGVATE